MCGLALDDCDCQKSTPEESFWQWVTVLPSRSESPAPRGAMGWGHSSLESRVCQSGRESKCGQAKARDVHPTHSDNFYDHFRPYQDSF